MKKLWLITALLALNAAFAQVDSLQKVLAGKKGHDRIPILNELCYQLTFIKPEQAIIYGTESISLLKGADSALMASTYNDASFPYYAIGNYAKMIELNKNALQIRIAIKDTLGQGASYSKIGLAYQEVGLLDSALENYKAASNIYTSLGNDVNRLSVLNNITNIYERLGDFEAAVKLHAEIQTTAERLGDEFNYYKSLANEATVLTKLKKYDLAEQKLVTAEEFFIRENLPEQIGSSYLARGINFKAMGDTLKAIEFYRKSDQAYTAHGVIASQPVINLGNTFLELNELDSAEYHLLRGIDLAKEVNSYTQLRHAYGALSMLEEKKLNFSKSLAYLKLKYVYQDSIFTESISDRISEYQIAYQTEKAEKISLEEQQKRMATELELSNRNKWLYGISGILVAVVLLSIVILQMRARRAQAEKNRAIVAEREKGLEAVFAATEDERQRIARDLHDGVGQRMSGLRLAMANVSVSIKSKLGEEAMKLNEINKLIDETASEIREISHQMMPKVLEEFGLISAIREMLDKSLKLTNIRYEFEHFNFDERLERKIELSLYRVTQELINNVIKHSKATMVSVQLFKSGGYLVLIVEDNGKGIENGAATDGHGMLNIRSRLTTIHGNVNFEASPNAGTTATIRIKLES